MEQEVLVKVEGLSKKFCKSLKKSLRYGVQDLVGSVLGKQPTDTLRKDEFWALQDINFELRRGECLGLIGHNGAGKSTLLKILNGLINPDHGKVTLRGRVGALIELGAGFNPILSGRENIYNNGAVLGFTKEEIDNKVEKIIDFAELREFIDMPVQNYSSGMKVRLGFAVAAQMEPDVLIIDEVLAVGDIGFRGKCYEAIGQMSKRCAIIFVSHSMPMIARISTESILLKNGIISLKGDVAQTIEAYYDQFGENNMIESIQNDFLKIEDISINTQDRKINWGDSLEINLNMRAKCDFKNVEINFMFLSREQIPVAQFNSRLLGEEIDFVEGLNTIVVNLESLCLTPGQYVLSVSMHFGKETILWTHGIEKLRVQGLNGQFGSAPYIIDSKWKHL